MEDLGVVSKPLWSLKRLVHCKKVQVPVDEKRTNTPLRQTHTSPDSHTPQTKDSTLTNGYTFAGPTLVPNIPFSDCDLMWLDDKCQSPYHSSYHCPKKDATKVTYPALSFDVVSLSACSDAVSRPAAVREEPIPREIWIVLGKRTASSSKSCDGSYDSISHKEPHLFDDKAGDKLAGVGRGERSNAGLQIDDAAMEANKADVSIHRLGQLPKVAPGKMGIGYEASLNRKIGALNSVTIDTVDEEGEEIVLIDDGFNRTAELLCYGTVEGLVVHPTHCSRDVKSQDLAKKGFTKQQSNVVASLNKDDDGESSASSFESTENGNSTLYGTGSSYKQSGWEAMLDRVFKTGDRCFGA
jgi:hypothetical protein